MASKESRLGLTLLALCAAAACAGEGGAAPGGAASAEGTFRKGGDDRTGPYDLIEAFWKPAPDHDSIWTWGSVSGVAADTPDRILVAIWGDQGRAGSGQGERPGSTNYLVAVDGNGNITENWSQWDSLFNRPHQVYISPYDPDRHVWVVERGGNGVNEQILKFTNDGSQLLMRLEDPQEVMGEQLVRAI
jgi:hypothetical protein